MIITNKKEKTNQGHIVKHVRVLRTVSSTALTFKYGRYGYLSRNVSHVKLQPNVLLEMTCQLTNMRHMREQGTRPGEALFT